MKSLYYAARGWDDNAVPRPETLAALGLAPLTNAEVRHA
jgi:aldehyde:ferredoxin oxidoreductase